MSYTEREYRAVYDKLAVTCDELLNGHLFEMARTKGHVDAYIQGQISLDDLAAEIDGYAATLRLANKTRQKNRPSKSAPTPAPTPQDHRAHALNAIYAIEAATRTDVMEFRSDHLGTGLVPFSEVGEWIKRTADSDGDPTVWITVPEEALDDARLSDHPALSSLPGYSEDTQSLYYTTEGARYTHSILIRSEGVLAELAEAAHWIVARYGWTEAAAVAFILTGRPPAAVGIKARKVEPWRRPKASRRIELDVPLSATKTEVADLYVQLRSEMLNTEPKSRRSLTQDHADMAVFAAKHRSGYTWKEARAIWNEQALATRRRQYSDTAQFTRKCREAYERVTGEKLEWIGKSADPASPRRNEPKET